MQSHSKTTQTHTHTHTQNHFLEDQHKFYLDFLTHIKVLWCFLLAIFPYNCQINAWSPTRLWFFYGAYFPYNKISTIEIDFSWTGKNNFSYSNYKLKICQQSKKKSSLQTLKFYSIEFFFILKIYCYLILYYWHLYQEDLKYKKFNTIFVLIFISDMISF